jgi:hypothetical protein
MRGDPERAAALAGKVAKLIALRRAAQAEHTYHHHLQLSAQFRRHRIGRAPGRVQIPPRHARPLGGRRL